MNHASIKNPAVLDASKIAIARLVRFSSQAESKIRQTYLVASDQFCGIRFEAGLFNAIWRIDQNWIEFKRGDQFIEQIPLGQRSDMRKAA